MRETKISDNGILNKRSGSQFVYRLCALYALPGHQRRFENDDGLLVPRAAEMGDNYPDGDEDRQSQLWSGASAPGGYHFVTGGSPPKHGYVHPADTPIETLFIMFSIVIEMMAKNRHIRMKFIIFCGPFAWRFLFLMPARIMAVVSARAPHIPHPKSIRTGRSLRFLFQNGRRRRSLPPSFEAIQHALTMLISAGYACASSKTTPPPVDDLGMEFER